MDDPIWDVLVAGGGPAGAVTALTAMRLGLEVLLVEGSPLDDDAVGPLAVGESLPSAARPLLESLQLLDLLDDGPHLISWGHRSAWGRDEVQNTDFIRDARGQHGWHLDRRAFDASLRRTARDAGAGLRSGWRVRSVSPLSSEDDVWQVELAHQDGNQQIVRSRFLVDATGRAANLARRLGPSTRHTGPGERHIALPLLFATDSAQDQDVRTLVESVPMGWWYSALLPHRRRMVCLFTDADILPATERGGGSLRQQIHQTEHLATQLEAGDWRCVKGLGVLAAGAVQRRPMAGPGWLAVGDAAVAFDPLASQGLFHALYCGLKAGSAVAEALQGNTEPVAELALRLDEVFRQHLRQCRLYYLSEQRFKDQPYWQRRHALGA